MHNLLAALAATTTLNMVSQPSNAGWEGANWGMTPEEVSAAVPGVRVVRWGMSLDNARRRGVKEAKLYEIELEASYFYGPDGLSFIRFDVPFRRCEALVDGLLDEHGQPTDVSEQVLLKVITWEDPEAGNRLVLLHSPSGICDLRIRSIEEAGNASD